MPTSSSTSTSFYSSSSTSSNGHEYSTGHRYQTVSHTDPDGTTTVRTIMQDMGQPVIVEEHRYDQTGRELAALPDAKSEGVRRIEDVGDLDEDVDAEGEFVEEFVEEPDTGSKSTGRRV
ncbi:uncharacterized protein BDV17DRAFT_271157 [Aspergillus undulatus]|uniref:uncharacterized protein n=1 Tax=Aspergillus undulatus TaxID=1810928 RepID=UPI003CCD8CCE